MRLVWTISSSSILSSTNANKRQREERSGAEATKLRVGVVVVAASNGSNVTPVETVGGFKRCTCHPRSLKGEAKRGLLLFSPLRCTGPHCGGLEAVVKGGARTGVEGLQAASPPPPPSLRDSHHPPD